MKEYYLHFEKNILDAEKKEDWVLATEQVYLNWEEAPTSIERLLCAGTELWYAMVLVDYYRYAPIVPVELNLPNYHVLETKLNDITNYGFVHFSKSPAFNIYFGYMIKCMPYFFLEYHGEYDKWREKGFSMIKKAYSIDPCNFLVKALLYSAEEKNDLFHDSCRKLWSQVSYQEWGDSKVQQYFFRILNGDIYCLRAHNEQ